MPRLCRFLAFLGLLTASSLFAQEAKRAPVPNEAALSEAKKLVAEVYRDDYAKARTLEQKIPVIEKLLADAQKSADDVTGKYALLVVSRDMATSAGDWELSLKAVEQLALAYDVDPYELADDVRAKIDLADKPPRDARAAYYLVMTVIDGAMAKDRYDVAERLTASAKKLARRVGDPQTAKQLAERIPDLQKLKRQFDEVKVALDKLQKDPVDAAANLAVGRFRCLVQGRWNEGVGMLALGNDPQLSKIAELELKQPTAPAELLALADGWWDLAEADKQNERAVRRHAVDRYLRALPRLEGLGKKKAETRIAESEQWLSKDAVYSVSKLHPNEPPLASLLNATERFYGDDPKSLYAFQIGQADAYIVIDLKREVPISRIYIQNRPVHDRTRGSNLYLSTSPDRRGEIVWTAPDNAAEWTIVLPKLQTARYITIARDPNVNGGDGWLHLRKVKVFGPE